MDSRRSRAITVLLVLALSPPPAAFAAVPGETELAAGVGLVKSGDFTSAITPLSAAIQTLAADTRRKEQLAKAYLYLGIAYLELGRELEARGKFREALRSAPKLKLSPEEFSGQVIRVFEAERLSAPKKKRNLLPLIFIVGGGAASAGVAVAAGGGGGSPTTTTAGATTTSTTTPTGGGGGSTTTTTQPSGGPTTTAPGATTTTTLPGAPTTTTTTLPGATTTTTTTTLPATTTTTTTTTMPPNCSYSASPAQQNFGLLGGTGTCNIGTTPQSCSWNLQKDPSNAQWLHSINPMSGTGARTVTFSVNPLSLGSRSAFIRIVQDPNKGCNVTQGGGLASSRALTFGSRLDAPGAHGQIVVNGSAVAFQGEALLNHAAAAREGTNRIEAIVVTADGRPGTWRFDLVSGFQPGSLVAATGPATYPNAGSVIFQVSGKPGQRFVFFFEGPREPGAETSEGRRP